MSLLMDALKKAEREKNRSATNDNSESTDLSMHMEPETVEYVAPSPDSSTPSDLDFSDEDTLEDSLENSLVPETFNPYLHADKLASEDPVSEQDDDWAFETAELEPFDQTYKSTLVDDTNIEVTSLQEALDKNLLEEEDNLSISNPIFNSEDLDHDVTLPSERAIQSSLKDYFDTTQATDVEHEQKADNTDIPAAPVNQRSTRSAPLDTSTTHVTAHTIFTANKSRQVSTGLTRYAIFGTLFLMTGLGLVALYYSYTTPTSINFPATFPEIANKIEPIPVTETENTSVKATRSPEIGPAISPKRPIEADNTESIDPVLVEVIKEIPESKAEAAPDETLQIANVEVAPTRGEVIKIKPSNPTMHATPMAPPVVSENAAIDEASVVETPRSPQQITAEPIITQTIGPIAEHTSGQVSNQVSNHEVITFSEPTISRQATEEANILKEEPDHHNYAVPETAFEVMSAEDFAEGLKAPKSAIKITKGRHSNGKPSHSALTEAYQSYHAGDFQRAKSIYRKVLNSRPDNRDAHLGLAAIAVREHNYETASHHYHYLLQQNPRDQVVNAALFNLQGNASGNVQESQLKLSLDQNSDSPQVHFSLGSFYAKQARWPEAQKSFFDAYSGDTSNADYAYNLAVSLDQLGQAKSALNYYRTALKLAQQSTVTFNSSRVMARIQKLSDKLKK